MNEFFGTEMFGLKLMLAVVMLSTAIGFMWSLLVNVELYKNYGIFDTEEVVLVTTLSTFLGCMLAAYIAGIKWIIS